MRENEYGISIIPIMYKTDVILNRIERTVKLVNEGKNMAEYRYEDSEKSSGINKCVENFRQMARQMFNPAFGDKIIHEIGLPQ